MSLPEFESIAALAWKNAHTKMVRSIDEYILQTSKSPTPEMIRDSLLVAVKYVLEVVTFTKVDPCDHVDVQAKLNPHNAIEVFLDVRAKTALGSVFITAYEETALDIDPRSII